MNGAGWACDACGEKVVVPGIREDWWWLDIDDSLNEQNVSEPIYRLRGKS